MNAHDPHEAAEAIARAVKVLKSIVRVEWTEPAIPAVAMADATVVNVDALRQAHLGESLDLDTVTLNPVWNNALFCYRQHFNRPDGTTSRWYTDMAHWLATPDPDFGWTAIVTYFTHVDGERDVRYLPLGLILKIDDDGSVISMYDYPIDKVGLDKYAKDGHARAFYEDQLSQRPFAPLFTLNLLNCRNIVLVTDPARPRKVSRRIARTGVRVSEIHVLPSGVRKVGGEAVKSAPLGSTPFHSVRGHPRKYGMDGRGLLFGKYAGQFWIPQHARGNPEIGTVEQTFDIESDAS